MGISSLLRASHLVEVLLDGRELSTLDFDRDILCFQFPFSAIWIRNLSHSKLRSRAHSSAIPWSTIRFGYFAITMSGQPKFLVFHLVLFYPLTLRESLLQISISKAASVVILLPKERYNRRRRNRRVIVRDLGEEMVRYVVRRDVVEEMGANDSEIAIYGCSSTTDEGPRGGVVLGYLWRGVV
jgi:hypothetical protein